MSPLAPTQTEAEQLKQRIARFREVQTSIVKQVRRVIVGQQHVSEDRAGHERPASMAGGLVFLDDVGAGHVRRHQVGGELDALEDQA